MLDNIEEIGFVRQRLQVANVQMPVPRRGPFGTTQLFLLGISKNISNFSVWNVAPRK
jgi:hypothetical protein